MVDAPAVRGVNKVAFQKTIQLIYYNRRHTRIIKRGWTCECYETVKGNYRPPINVRFWGVKQTCRFEGTMSANDPKRTLDGKP
jgi:hypothetical protein